MWIIYAHINKINNKRYIGQTKQTPNQRWRRGEGYKGSTYFYHAIQKYGWENFEHQILEENISTQEEANEREICWINIFQSNNPDYGYNLTKGGYLQPVRAIEKIKELWQDEDFYSRFGIKVICTNNGQVYKSIKEASRRTGADAGGISDNCRGKLNSSGIDKETGMPLVWEFYDEDKHYEYIHPLKKSKRAKPVICLTTGKIFDSITQAAKYYGIESDATSISKCCKKSGKRKYAGIFNGQKLMWSYYDPNVNYQIGQQYHRTGSKPIKCITTGEIYSSITEASKKTGIPHSNLTACCKGKIKTAKGLRWEYYNGEVEENGI